MRHPLDPPAAHAAAAFLGHLAAAGLADSAEVQRVLRAAAARAGRVDRSGLAARLAHAFSDSRTHWARQRQLAADRIHARLAPVLQAGEARGAVMRAAEAAADESLLPGEVRALAASFVAERLRRGNLWRR